MCSIKIRDDSKNLNELISRQDKIKALRSQDNLGKQNFQEDMKKVFEPVTETINVVSEDVTKTMTKTCFANKKKLEIL